LVEKVHSQNRLSGRGALAFRGKGALDSRALKVFEQRKIGYLKTYKKRLEWWAGPANRKPERTQVKKN
jgi:hypothetical protein